MTRRRVLLAMLATSVALPALAQITTRLPLAGGDPVVTPDGTFVASSTGVLDRRTGSMAPLAIGLPGEQVTGFRPNLSDDGRFVCFTSLSPNLDSGDTIQCWDPFIQEYRSCIDVFVTDLSVGSTERVSVDSSGAAALADSREAAISGDGRFVVFTSSASNLVAGDTNDCADVFLFDRATRATVRLSVGRFGAEGDRESSGATISRDGRWVAFASYATNLLPTPMPIQQIYVRDLQTGSVAVASVDTAGIAANDTCRHAALSADGRTIVFESTATNLVPSGASSGGGLFVHDLVGGVTERIAGGSTDAALSANGRFVVFSSVASDLVPHDTNLASDHFVWDRQTRSFERVSVNSAGGQARTILVFSGARAAVTQDGRFVVFESSLDGLVDDGAVLGVYLRDRAPCAAGTARDVAGSPVDVLRVNGSAGDGAGYEIALGVAQPFRISLDAAPAGPSEARWVLWVWRGFGSSQTDFSRGGASLGCTVSPTPLRPGAPSQPRLCLRGGSMAAGLCGSARSLRGPRVAPWTLASTGFRRHESVFTIQGLIEDAGSNHPSGFSVTNAITLHARWAP